MYKDFPAHGNSLQSLYCRKEFYITPMNGSLWERKQIIRQSVPGENNDIHYLTEIIFREATSHCRLNNKHSYYF